MELEEKTSSSINHLQTLNDNPFTLQKVAFWLYEYDDFYKEIKNFANYPCQQCKELGDLELPYDCLLSPEYCTRRYNHFTDFYEEVRYGVEIQELDSVCKMALQEYLSTSGDMQMKEWVIKYYELLYNRLCIFYYAHLDHSVENNEIKHPHFGNSPIGEFGVCIDRKYYENIIEFQGIFSILFYEKKIYPEKLKEIEEENKRIEFPTIPL